MRLEGKQMRYLHFCSLLVIIALISNFLDYAAVYHLLIDHATNDPWWSFEAIIIIVVNISKICTQVFSVDLYQTRVICIGWSQDLTAYRAVKGKCMVTCQAISFVHWFLTSVLFHWKKLNNQLTKLLTDWFLLTKICIK